MKSALRVVERVALIRFLFAISVFNWVFTSIIQSPRFTNDYKFGISVNIYQ